MPSFVSQPLGPIYVRMSRVAGDAFNAAARDDTDPMRQTDGRTARREGREALCGKLRQTTYGLPLMPSLQGTVLYNIQVSDFSAKYSAKKTALPTQHFGFYMYLQPMDRFTYVSRYASIWILSVCLFRAVCMHSCLHVHVLCAFVCVSVCARAL